MGGLQRVQGGQKVGLLRSETMPKQFPNNSKKTSKKSRNRLFRPPKLTKLESQSGQKVSIFGSIVDLRALFFDFWCRKSRFLDFFKVGFDLFRKCYIRHCFVANFSLFF